jgi:Transglutaminase elicitor
MMKLLALTVLGFSTLASADRINGINSPLNFQKVTGSSMVTALSLLPGSGRLSDSRLGWSETYWPSNKGGIAYRWNSPDPQPFKYKVKSLAELKNMTQDELGQLSPAELYDIAQGDYNYTLTRKVLSLFTPRDLWWEGICHGWSPAAANFPEPGQVVVTNKDGIKVPFGSSDVKGLLSMYDAYNYNRASYASVGKRCAASGKVPGEGDSRDPNPNPPSDADANTEECKDVNAGAFHIVITNMIGIHSKGFVADVDRFNDVWNQPVTSYSSQIVGDEPLESDDSFNGVARRVRVNMKMTYGEELKFWTPELEATGVKNFVSKLPVTGTVHQEFRSKDYIYILELDSSGRIVGGEWITETRPDFLWTITRETKFKNSPFPLAGLNTIYRPVRR